MQVLVTSVGLSSIIRIDPEQQWQQHQQQRHHRMGPETATPLSLSTLLPLVPLATSSPILSLQPPPRSTIHDSLEFRLAAAATAAATLNTTTFTSPNVTMNCATGEPFELLSPGSGHEATLCGTLTASVHTAWGNTVFTAFNSSPTTALLLQEKDGAIASAAAATADIKHRSSRDNFSSSSSPVSHENVTRHKSNHRRKVRAGIKLFSLHRTRYVR
jgi:hypothetical protein